MPWLVSYPDLPRPPTFQLQGWIWVRDYAKKSVDFWHYSFCFQWLKSLSKGPVIIFRREGGGVGWLFFRGGRGYYIVAGERRQDQSPLTECNGEDYRKLVAVEGGQWNTKGLWWVSGKLHCDTTKIFVLNPDPPRPHDCNSFQFQRKIWVRDFQNPPGTLLTPAINSNQSPM